jgi:HTH-type transcriptional regulator/antitoxin HipB
MYVKYRKLTIVFAMNRIVMLPEQLSAHLKSLRKAAGLTQAQLGENLGVGQVRIAEIEKDPGAISVRQLMRLLNALGSSLALSDPKGSTNAKTSSAASKSAKGEW